MRWIEVQLDAGTVLLYKVKSDDMLLRIVCIMEFERRLRLVPSPPKLPVKLAAYTLPNERRAMGHKMETFKN